MKFQLIVVGALVTVLASMGIGIIIGHFAIAKKETPSSWKYDRLTRRADPKNYQTFIDSIQAANIEANLKYHSQRSHFN